MRPPVPFTEDQILRLGAALAGAIFLSSGAIAAELARDHMVALGTICGATDHPHCGWCLGAASLVLAGLVAFAAALRPQRKAGDVGLLQIKVKPDRS